MSDGPIILLLGYAGAGLILFGFFLIITGFGVVKIEKITVLPGRKTLGAGIMLASLGLLFLLPDVAETFLEANSLPTPDVIDTKINIPFVATNDPQNLNPSLKWIPGGRANNSFELDSKTGALMLIGDTSSDQWGFEDDAPKILFAYDGNVDTQVKVQFPQTSGHEFAGIGIRSEPYTWVRLAKGHWGGEQFIVVDVNDAGNSNKTAQIAYPALPTVYLRITRQDDTFYFYYGADGQTWLNAGGPYTSIMPNDVEIFLITSSWGDPVNGTLAYFYDFQVR